MSAEEHILNCSQLVTAGAFASVHFTPANGDKVNPVEFVADVPQDAKCVARMVWDYTTTSATNGNHLWSISNNPQMPHGMADHMTLQQTGDGVKKMAIVFENNGASDYYFSAHAELEIS